jgi:hypothetical protein
MRRFLALALVGGLFLFGAAPSQARWGVHRISTEIRSGDQDVGPSYSGAWTPTIVRRVQPGNGVAFWLDGIGHGQPVPAPTVRGCSSSGGIDVRYILETAAGDRDITDKVTGGGWSRAHANRIYWNVTVRIAIHVGSQVAPGSALSCRVTLNREPVRANVEVV